jgi:predicted small lipoprotein YifL
MTTRLFRLFAASLLLVLAVSACGKKGALYLPDQPADSARK